MMLCVRHGSPNTILEPIFFLFLLCAAMPFVSAADAVRPRFNLPADAAEHTLRLFANQSGLEVLFSRTSTAGVRTNALQGDYPPFDAVTQVLAGSVLEAAQDAANGALIVSCRRSSELAPSKEALLLVSLSLSTQIRRKSYENLSHFYRRSRRLARAIDYHRGADRLSRTERECRRP